MQKYNIEERTLNFSKEVILHVSRLKQPTLQSIVGQVIRSSTSIGANYAEAINVSLKIDFKNKIFIAKKEAAETKYWLKLLEKLGDKTENLAKLQKENQELLMILQKTISSLRKRNEK